MVAPNPDFKDDEDAFWTIYVKGMARSCCALVVADLIMTDQGELAALPVGVAAPAVAGSLAASFAMVHIRRGTVALDRTSVALENARLSAKGAIRQAHDVITWVGTLRILQKSNPALDAAGVIKRFNAMSTSQTQLMGGQAHRVPPPAREGAPGNDRCLGEAHL